MKDKKEISDIHKQFVDDYLTTGMVASHSYKRIFPKAQSKNGIEVNAHKILKRPEVREYIEYSNADLRTKLCLTREHIMVKLDKLLNECMDGDKIIDKPMYLKTVQAISKTLGYDEDIQVVKHDLTGVNIQYLPPAPQNQHSNHPTFKEITGTTNNNIDIDYEDLPF